MCRNFFVPLCHKMECAQKLKTRKPLTTDQRERRNAITARYYERNRHEIIRKKTLYKVRTTGRVPRETTLAKNGISRDDVVKAMFDYVQSRKT